MNKLKTAYFRLHEMLPESLRSRLIELWKRSSVRRSILQRRSEVRKQVKQMSISRHGTFGPTDLLGILRDNGIQSGDVLFVQCSFNDMHTFQASPLELLKVLESLVGATGTLLMPAYTNVVSSRERPFRPGFEVTYTGILSETFRRSAGVLRSLHPRHSICGRGPMAASLLEGHERCARADGVGSPFDKLRLLPNAKILTLGLPPGHVSFLHWLEDFEPAALPFVVHRSEPVTSILERIDGSVVEVLDWQLRTDISARLSLASVVSQLSSEACDTFEFKGVAIGIYQVQVLSAELLSLRDRGIIHYV